MSYTSELQQDYAERRARLFNPGVKPPQPSIVRRPYNPTIWHDRKRDVIMVASKVRETPPPEFDVIILPPAAWRAIVFEVCQKHGISFKEFSGGSRRHHLVVARQEACYRLSVETTLSLTQIGLRLNRDHTTVLHSIKKHKERLALAVAA